MFQLNNNWWLKVQQKTKAISRFIWKWGFQICNCLLLYTLFWMKLWLHFDKTNFGISHKILTFFYVKTCRYWLLYALLKLYIRVSKVFWNKTHTHTHTHHTHTHTHTEECRIKNSNIKKQTNAGYHLSKK